MFLLLHPQSVHERPFVKNFEEFAIDYHLTAHILIRYGQKYIAHWEINTKRKHKREKNHLHDAHSLKVCRECT